MCKNKMSVCVTIFTVCFCLLSVSKVFCADLTINMTAVNNTEVKDWNIKPMLRVYKGGNKEDKIFSTILANGESSTEGLIISDDASKIMPGFSVINKESSKDGVILLCPSIGVNKNKLKETPNITIVFDKVTILGGVPSFKCTCNDDLCSKSS